MDARGGGTRRDSEGVQSSSASSSSASSVSRVSRLETLLTALGEVADPAVVAAKRQSTITELGFDPSLVLTQVSPEEAARFAAVAPPLKQLRKQPSSAAVKHKPSKPASVAPVPSSPLASHAPLSPPVKLPPAAPADSSISNSSSTHPHPPKPAAATTAAPAAAKKLAPPKKNPPAWRSLLCCCDADPELINDNATTTANTSAAADSIVDADRKLDSSSSATTVNTAQPSSLVQMSTAPPSPTTTSNNERDSSSVRQRSTKSKKSLVESVKEPREGPIPVVPDDETTDDTAPRVDDDSGGRRTSSSVHPTPAPSHMSESGESVVQYVLPPQKPEHVGKKCLILDLDETLVHSAFKPVSNADFIIPIKIEDNYHNVYVLKRPHVEDFLEKMAAHFELVVFTASVSNYADPVLDLLDPKGLVQYRLYREHCVQYNQNYVKDLTVLGRPLEDCIIIDNNPMAYAFQPSNAIPCATWIDDMEDDELVELQPFLIGLKAIPDVRTVLGVDSDDAYDSVPV